MGRTRIVSSRRMVAWLAAAAATTGLGLTHAMPASADPIPTATYGGATSGRVLDLGINALGLANITAGIGVSTTAVGSKVTPRASASSANLAVGALGIPIAVASGSATAGPAVASPTYTTDLAQVDVLPVLDTGLLTGSGLANWAGDAQCVPAGTPMAQATTQMAGATVGITGINILTVGTVSTTGSTQHAGTGIVSTSAGTLAGATLLNGLVTIAVVANPTITATSTGATTSVTANAYAIDVTVGATTTRLTAGQSLHVGLGVGVATASIDIGVGALTNTSAGTTASGSASFISITGTITPIVGPALATINTSILPLSASATAPATGGVECNRLDLPTITTPTEASTTNDTTPTITGTGVPGAALTVREGALVLGTTTVAPDGSWTLTPATPLAAGPHAITATQALGTATSDTTAVRNFTVVDDAPIGTTTVDPAGAWTLIPSTALATGTATVTASQADRAGNVSPEDSVEFRISPDGSLAHTGADVLALAGTAFLSLLLGGGLLLTTRSRRRTTS